MQNGEAEDNEEDDFNVDEESDQSEEKEQEVSLDSEKSESEDEERDPLATKTVQGRRTNKTWTSAHRGDQIIGDPSAGVTTRRRMVGATTLLSQVEPKSVEEAIQDKAWVKAINEELDQIEKNDIWELVPRPTNKNVIGTK